MSHRRPFTRSRSSSLDSSGDEEVLDEEHQETLITDLAQSDEERSALYRRIFLFVPLLCTLPFLLILLFPSSSASSSRASGARDRLLALLSVSSLLCTAWWLWYMPYGSSNPTDAFGVSRLNTLASYSSTSRYGEGQENDGIRSAKGKSGSRMGWKEQAGARGDARGPLERYLGLLNGGLAGVLLGTAVLLAMKGSSSNDPRGHGETAGFDVWRWAVPALVFALTAAVRQQLAPLDLQDLQQARYEYKGA